MVCCIPYTISSIIKESFKSSKKTLIRVTPKSAAFSDSARKYKGTYILDDNEVSLGKKVKFIDNT